MKYGLLSSDSKSTLKKGVESDENTLLTRKNI
jgi:hypothetical protein